MGAGCGAGTLSFKLPPVVRGVKRLDQSTLVLGSTYPERALQKSATRLMSPVPSVYVGLVARAQCRVTGPFQ